MYLFLLQKEYECSCYIYFDRIICTHPLFEQFIQQHYVYFQKKVGFSYASFERHLFICIILYIDIIYRHYVYRILAAIYFFNGIVYFSDVKIYNHPILPTQFVSAYFRTPVIVKQISYRRSCTFRAASTLLK